MSSATSTEPSTSLGAGASDGAFRPWQFFLLAGMLAATATVIVATGQSPASIVLLSLTIIAASLVGFTVYRTLLPLVSPEAVHAPLMVAGRTRAALEREKALALRSIKELEFDFAMGKVAQGDFDEMTGRLRGRALRLMRQLEAGGYRGVIEKELALRIGAVPGGSKTPPRHVESEHAAVGVVSGGAPFDALPLAQGREAPPLPVEAEDAGVVAGLQPRRQCACGTENDPDARFCKNCGEKLDRPV